MALDDPTGLHLPVDPLAPGSQRAWGFLTPVEDLLPQVACFAPRRVLPVVFLPGIMGSNLRITSAERLRQLGRRRPEDNVAWRPDAIDGFNAQRHASADAAERQLALDPQTTAVDVYNPHSGSPGLDGDQRHANVALGREFFSPFLADDPPGRPGRRSAVHKARERGWGEVFFGSYGALLQRLEQRLNRCFSGGQPHPGWHGVLGVDPARWHADPRLPQAALSADELGQVARGCWFPVHAVGYNWLQSNGVSARAVAARIRRIIQGYAETLDDHGQPKFECTRVIVVTHSMGGLVARALIHPSFGGLGDEVLGVVHGVQPALGAAAAYKRMRAGFEDPGLLDPLDSVAAKVAGNCGDEVTAVLANAPGALQLLPSRDYGAGWLRVVHRGRVLLSLPRPGGDPYEEIYKLRGRWFGLLPHEHWINPSGLTVRQGGATLSRTWEYLDRARTFHAAIAGTYHPCTYAHYGADPGRPSFGDVTWEIGEACSDPAGWPHWAIRDDSRQGRLALAPTEKRAHGAAAVRLLPPDEPGDQTVPMRSADDQLLRGRCRAVFRQTGYEHQGSYQDEQALAATLYSIVRIAQQARWRTPA